MELEFWHAKWEKGEIGFHQPEVNSLLATYLDTIELDSNSRIFVPLCGKTLDISWLLSQGYRVVGAELNALAIEQLFDELAIKPTIASIGIASTGKIKHYVSDRLEVFVGDIFDLSQKMLGGVDLVYDRAALVALPLGMRKDYTAHLISISQQAPQLLVCFEYDQAVMEGPPFSIKRKEVEQHYQSNYQLTLLASEQMPEKLKDKVAAQETIWHLK